MRDSTPSAPSSSVGPSPASSRSTTAFVHGSVGATGETALGKADFSGSTGELARRPIRVTRHVRAYVEGGLAIAVLGAVRLTATWRAMLRVGPVCWLLIGMWSVAVLPDDTWDKGGVLKSYIVAVLVFGSLLFIVLATSVLRSNWPSWLVIPADRSLRDYLTTRSLHEGSARRIEFSGACHPGRGLAGATPPQRRSASGRRSRGR